MPTSYAVLDSGILLAAVQSEPHTQHARTLIAQLAQDQIQLVAPVLLHYEIISVVRKWVARALITPDNAHIALTVLLKYPIITVVDNGLLSRAYEIATEHNRPTAYDAQYLAVAEQYQCNFWTADKRLFNSITNKFPHIHWVGNVNLEER